MTKHAAVWIDQQEAKIFLIDEGGALNPEKLSPHHHIRRHSVETAEHAHPTDAAHFFQAVEKALADVQEVLVVGPGKAKLELIKHVHKHDHALEPRIVGVETVDHPTDGQLVKHAHAYFRAKDRMLGTAP